LPHSFGLTYDPVFAMPLYAIDALLTQLARHTGTPFSHLPESARADLQALLRVFDLHPGDRISLTQESGSTYVSVLAGNGTATLDEGKPVALSQDHTTLLSTARGARLTLTGNDGSSLRVCVSDAEVIDDLLTIETLTAGMDAGRRASIHLLERARKSPAFRRVPLESAEQALDRMGRRTVKAGEEIVRQGEPGDCFYFMSSGTAEVWETGLYDDEPKRVAILMAGDTFGEEALVTGGTRSATVRMTSDGELLTLEKDDYQTLISRELLDEVDPPMAKVLLDGGHRLLDVRYAEEHEESHIPGCELIPLYELRARMGTIDRNAKWVVYCRSGRRSAVAALLMKQNGITATSLRGGINAWPHEINRA